MKILDPPRLRHAAKTDPLLRSALETNADEPTQSELEALAANLGIPFVSAPIGRPTLGGPSAAGALAVAKTKLLTGLFAPALVGAMVGGVVWQATEPARVRTAAPAASIERPNVLGATGPAVEAPAAMPAPAVSPAVLDAPSVPPPTVPPRRAPSIAREPSLPTPSVSESVPPQAWEPPAPPLSEVELLERAKALVPNDPNGALALTAEHTLRFPQGMLAQEAEVIAIEALVGANRPAAAEAKLVQFRTRFGGSAYLPRLESLVRQRK